MTPTFLDLLVYRFTALEADLNALDAATGDGDHGATILKGLRAAAAAPDDPARAFRAAAGGASGTIFSHVIDALAQPRTTPLPDALARAASRIMQIGMAKAGDKTMLDALIPASRAADAAGAAFAARAGAEATRAMAARRGRARHVEGAGVGYLDAGAVSVAEILELYADNAK
jgi:phosphoenolpyruvate---glycerone phosphotransferase subunit DhaL